MNEPIQFATMIFVAIAGIATSVMALPVIVNGYKFLKKIRWKRKMRSNDGECEDDNKIIYIAEKAVEYFPFRHDTHEVYGIRTVGAENEQREREGKEPLDSDGNIVTIEFDRFKKFVMEIMKDYDETPFTGWLLTFEDDKGFRYADRKKDISYTHFYYFVEERTGKSLVDLYTEPVKNRGCLRYETSLYIRLRVCSVRTRRRRMARGCGEREATKPPAAHPYPTRAADLTAL